MNIILTTPQYDNIIYHYIENFIFLNIKRVRSNSRYPNSVFFMDSNLKILIEYDEIEKSLYVSYKEIIQKLESIFKISAKDAKSFIERYVINNYNLDIDSVNSWSSGWGNINIGGFLPIN